MKVEAVVEVRYTEDREKVLKALENVFTCVDAGETQRSRRCHNGHLRGG